MIINSTVSGTTFRIVVYKPIVSVQIYFKDLRKYRCLKLFYKVYVKDMRLVRKGLMLFLPQIKKKIHAILMSLMLGKRISCKVID